MTGRKKPGVAFWATVVVVVVPVLYLLSVGPIIGMMIRLPVPLANRACSAARRTYMVPQEVVMSRMPKWVREPYYQYCYFFQ
jgi:hypothetical protein